MTDFNDTTAENNQRLNQNFSHEPVNFAEVLTAVEAHFPMVQILDQNGIIANEAMEPKLTDSELVELMKRMLFARKLHEETTNYVLQARLGFYAPTLGQEAAQMASSFAFEKDDWLYGGYRDLPQIIAHGGSIAQVFLWSKGHVAGGQYGEQNEVKAAVPQIIIGAQMIQAMGNAVGQKLNGSKNVSFAYTGDGGSSQGDTYEALNFAGRYKAPVIFFIQNNEYAISTPRAKQTAAHTLAQKAVAAGIPGVQVDGNDPLAVYALAKQARDWAVAGNGPVVIEMVTNRLGAHSTSGDDPLRYRSQKSIDDWMMLEPLNRYRIYLANKGLWNEEMEAEFLAEVKTDITKGMEIAENTPKMTVSESLKWQYANPTQNILEQIEYYEAEEGNK